MSNNVKPLNGNGSWIDYCNRKRERSNYTYRVGCDGEGYYINGGERLTEQQFNEMLPIGLISNSRYGNERLDSRQNLY